MSAPPVGVGRPANQGTDSAVTIDLTADTSSQPRHLIRLPLDVNGDPVDAEGLALVLELVADLLPQTSRTAAVLTALAGEIVEAELNRRPLHDYLRREQTRRELARAWRDVEHDERLARGRPAWDSRRFEREWRRYPNAATGYPFALPYKWYYAADRLAATGLPWFVVRDQIHDTLTGPRPSYAAVLRGCRRTLRRLRHRAEGET